MKIVVATTTGFHLRHLAREWIAAGHDVTYMTYLPNFRIRRDRIALERSRSFFWRLAPDSIHALNRRWPSRQRRATQEMLRRADEAYAAALPPCDVLVALSAMADKCARVARSRYGARVVIERGSTHVLKQSALVADGADSLPPEYVARELTSYEVADIVALPSSHAVESFVEQGFSRPRLFKNIYGVDLQIFQSTPKPPGPLRLLFVGQWSTRKGCDALVEILRRRPDLSLTHVGLPVDLGLPQLANFKSLGHRTHPELSALMASHHMLLLPSREDGFGMVLIEALACGLPVIASTRTGAPDLAEIVADREAIVLVAPADPEALLEGVESATRYVERQKGMREILTPSDRRNLSWTAYAKRYHDFLSELR